MSESEYDDEQWRGEAGSDGATRAPFRLPVEMPRPVGARESRTIGRAVSIAVHAAIVIAMLLPALLSPKVRSALVKGAGGAGPAGGGGGSGGFMGVRETLRYVRVAPEPTPKQATPTPTPVPTPPKPQVVQPTPPQVQPQATPPPQQSAPSTGAASGSGDPSGTGGAGPGSGGGTGSGVGTGIGSANGPGTGGGADSVYPPQPTQLFLPPTPVPSKIRGDTIVAEFEVDSLGRVLRVDFNETRDGGYNKKLRDALAKIRFRPAVKRDGTPVRARTQIAYLL
ncbi:MAG: hypothetical protein HOQ09_12145 [Gemmatimonadaceae bacterium]|nr:hypothetical protein [Gemmatimonadaceae bacterium]